MVIFLLLKIFVQENLIYQGKGGKIEKKIRKALQKWVIILGNCFWCHLQTKNIETRERRFMTEQEYFFYSFPPISSLIKVPAHCSKIQNTSAIIFDCFNGGENQKTLLSSSSAKFFKYCFLKTTVKYL